MNPSRIRITWSPEFKYTLIKNMFGKSAPVTGADANNAGDFELEQYIHLRMLNDGFLITPFHNMALMCPDTSEADVDAHTKAFRAMCAELVQ